MAQQDQLAPWSAPAVNLAEHASNPIHTDDGARAAGFASALVAGVTIYAYMTHVPAAAWGVDWLGAGGAQVRFRTPVCDGEPVDYVPTTDDVVEARVRDEVRATCAVQRTGMLPPRCTGVGDRLDPISFVADDSSIDYALRAGDDLTLYTDQQVLHPVTWMRVANAFFHEQVVSGPWIHVRSDLQHHGLAAIGSTIEATAVVVDRFDSRAGLRAILDVRIHADGRPVASYEHEAIIELTDDAGDVSA